MKLFGKIGVMNLFTFLFTNMVIDVAYYECSGVGNNCHTNNR